MGDDDIEGVNLDSIISDLDESDQLIRKTDMKAKKKVVPNADLKN